ncbi:unnamed protein product [Microthlaspi erraticum]|uniref:Arabidopsis retrotransposon Orf1 C-terminal domain-containing protein n=1 Tax=Microthlaspi erraticum TaxID=1685480 RepID=A0A6D2KID1_9BRAS|nr:unnamed protein product [Microthlaspi erraticum]
MFLLVIHLLPNGHSSQASDLNQALGGRQPTGNGSTRPQIDPPIWSTRSTRPTRPLYTPTRPPTAGTHQVSDFRNRGDYSRRREDIARGKRPVVSDDDFVEELTMHDAPFPETLRDDEPDDTLTEIEILRLRSLLDMRFGGTRYADRDTMQTLRFAEDVDEMFTNVGIGRLMYQQHKSYRKATCLLLAAFTDHPCDAGKYTPDGSDGYISFWATGRRHYLSYRARRSATSQGDRQHALLAPGHRERHRDEMAMIDVALTGIPVETDQRDPAQRQQITRRHHARACEPAPLLPGLGVEEQRHPAQVHITDGRLGHTSPTRVGFTLIGRRRSHHPRGSTRVPEEQRLPAEDVRRQTAPLPVFTFSSALPACCFPAPAGPRSEEGPTSSSTHLSPLFTRRSTVHGRARPSPLRGLHHHCQTERRTEGGSPAHQHSSAVEQGADKITSKLKSKVKKMADQIRAMQDKLSCVASASGGVQRTAVGPRQADLSEDDDEPHHDTTGGRPLPPDPPRHSSFEPRQQRKRRHGERQTARPSGTRADADLPFRRCSLSPDRRLRRIITLRRRGSTGPVRAYSTERAAPTTIPPYTQESMQEDLDDSFTDAADALLTSTRPITTTVSFHFPFSFSFIESV